MPITSRHLPTKPPNSSPIKGLPQMFKYCQLDKLLGMAGLRPGMYLRVTAVAQPGVAGQGLAGEAVQGGGLEVAVLALFEHISRYELG